MLVAAAAETVHYYTGTASPGSGTEASKYGGSHLAAGTHSDGAPICSSADVRYMGSRYIPAGPAHNSYMGAVGGAPTVDTSVVAVVIAAD